MTTKVNTSDLKRIYDEAIRLARSHYENFPVISFLISKQLVPHIAVVYTFARRADDIADEGNIPDTERLKLLKKQEELLLNALNGKPADNFWKALANTITELNLTPENFLKLLKAFSQDTLKKQYEDFQELLAYCENSANPVGRIVLEIFNIRNEKTFSLSDKICTALQLTNFWQDVSIDLGKERIYIPEEYFRKFNYDKTLLMEKQFTPGFREMMNSLVSKTEEIFFEGREILNRLPFRLKSEINFTILGGMTILKKIEEINFNVLNYRVTLNKKDILTILLKTFLTLE